MNKLPLVSVAIITYNQKELLKECIDSVLSQTYENIEIVVADDGSKDGTKELLLEYKKEYGNKFILKISPMNKGITCNSNLAHFACSGKYIAWIGGDDLMFSEKIAKQVNHMEQNPECTIVYHNLDIFDSLTNKTIRLMNDSRNSFEGGVAVLIKNGTFNGACSTMVRASKSPNNGFDVRIPVASDWLYWIESVGNGGSIHYIDEVLGRYRKHSQNVTKKSDKITQNELDHLSTCNILFEKYPENISEIQAIYSKRIMQLRRKLPYGKALLFSLRLDFKVKKAIALIMYMLTFCKVRL